MNVRFTVVRLLFPFLFGGTFIEAKANNERFSTQRFPYSFVGTFIEAGSSLLAQETPQLSLQL